MKELKNIQGLKIEIETIKKITKEIENLEKRSGILDASIIRIGYKR